MITPFAFLLLLIPIVQSQEGSCSQTSSNSSDICIQFLVGVAVDAEKYNAPICSQEERSYMAQIMSYYIPVLIGDFFAEEEPNHKVLPIGENIEVTSSEFKLTIPMKEINSLVFDQLEEVISNGGSIEAFTGEQVLPLPMLDSNIAESLQSSPSFDTDTSSPVEMNIVASKNVPIVSFSNSPSQMKDSSVDEPSKIPSGMPATMPIIGPSSEMIQGSIVAGDLQPMTSSSMEPSTTLSPRRKKKSDNFALDTPTEISDKNETSIPTATSLSSPNIIDESMPAVDIIKSPNISSRAEAPSTVLQITDSPTGAFSIDDSQRNIPAVMPSLLTPAPVSIQSPSFMPTNSNPTNSSHIEVTSFPHGTAPQTEGPLQITQSRNDSTKIIAESISPVNTTIQSPPNQTTLSTQMRLNQTNMTSTLRPTSSPSGTVLSTKSPTGVASTRPRSQLNVTAIGDAIVNFLKSLTFPPTSTPTRSPTKFLTRSVTPQPTKKPVSSSSSDTPTVSFQTKNSTNTTSKLNNSRRQLLSSNSVINRESKHINHPGGVVLLHPDRRSLTTKRYRWGGASSAKCTMCSGANRDARRQLLNNDLNSTFIAEYLTYFVKMDVEVNHQYHQGCFGNGTFLSVFFLQY
jgi:cell wall-associated NlpC family hydrolase